MIWVTADSARVYVANACDNNRQGTVRLVDVASAQVLRTVVDGGNPNGIARATRSWTRSA